MLYCEQFKAELYNVSLLGSHYRFDTATLMCLSEVVVFFLSSMI